ncbi:hypothetical protein TGAMA5MH_03774 [Trichoderma gamsii]|uniref:Uncharacterized protein n=1 Tax=Trichoderma gamsii TaxID=398673 RepID=A0A2K0TG22_9HYPO|nr:hypothetical protein TGAMA5MH_03774 [Trichoderma gamsii]
MVVYNVPRGRSQDEVVGFAIAGKKVKQKRGRTRAALLAIQMLWFLEPDQFVWKKARGQEKREEEAKMYSTQYVRKATEQYRITNNILATLGWIDSRGNELNAKSEMLRIASQETLRARLRLLGSLMSRPADFIREVFQNNDPKWVNQCRAIIK